MYQMAYVGFCGTHRDNSTESTLHTGPECEIG